jgi:hypothetical protein
MNNLETVIAVLERHREGRHWADLNVARDVLSALNLPESEPAPMSIAEADAAMETATPATTNDAPAEPSATA